MKLIAFVYRAGGYFAWGTAAIDDAGKTTAGPVGGNQWHDPDSTEEELVSRSDEALRNAGYKVEEWVMRPDPERRHVLAEATVRPLDGAKSGIVPTPGYPR